VVIFISCFIVAISLTNAQYRALEVLFRRVKQPKLRLQGLTSGQDFPVFGFFFFSLRSQGVLRVVSSDTISYKR
jgi:hypothetical protein